MVCEFCSAPGYYNCGDYSSQWEQFLYYLCHLFTHNNNVVASDQGNTHQIWNSKQTAKTFLTPP